MIITFIGKRLNGSKLHYVYKTHSGNFLHFAKKITAFDVLGDQLECEFTEKGVRGPYKKVGVADALEVTEWSVANRLAIEKKKELDNSKIEPDSSMEMLIKAVRYNCTTASERARIALYIYNKIV